MSAQDFGVMLQMGFMIFGLLVLLTSAGFLIKSLARRKLAKSLTPPPKASANGVGPGGAYKLELLPKPVRTEISVIQNLLPSLHDDETKSLLEDICRHTFVLYSKDTDNRHILEDMFCNELRRAGKSAARYARLQQEPTEYLADKEETTQSAVDGFKHINDELIAAIRAVNRQDEGHIAADSYVLSTSKFYH